MRLPLISLAPMEGVVDPILRIIYSSIGGFDRFTTEFVRVTDKLLPPHVFEKYCPELLTGGKTAEGVPVYVQLLGGQASPIAENAALVAELGAPGVDLNFGCPAKTVNRHDGGATLLKNPSRLFEIISAVRKAVPYHIPVTAKVRLGFSDKSLVQEIAEAVDTSGAASLVVHARTRDEGYRPPAHWEYIAQMKSAMKTVPLIANGDITSVEEYFRCKQISGCESVAIGRPAISCPDLALQIRSAIKNETYVPLEWSAIAGNLLPHFIRLSREAKSDHFALTRLKQWLRFLASQYPEAARMFSEVKRAQALLEIQPETMNIHPSS